jgi:hypothetical protein
MSWIVVLINGILGRIDGWGKGDGFLPFWPLNKLRVGGINYTRYLIGLTIFLLTWNWIYLVTYAIAASIPYGEKHWWMKYGVLSWFLIGAIFGGASLSWANTLWVGMLVIAMKFWDTDQAVFEFMFYSLGTLWVVFR